jgi:signal transduction histidine kinase
LHYSSTPHFDPGASPTPCPEHPSFIGVIDTALKPAELINRCGEFVAEICELQYGVRPKWEINGEPDTTFVYVPMHLEYIVTELLKNAFRATIEHCGTSNLQPIVITIAPEPPATRPQEAQRLHDEHVHTPPRGDDHRSAGLEADALGVPGGHVILSPREASRGKFKSDDIQPLDDNAPGVTIRIRDRGGGISPEVLPNIWSYSFTTFNDDQDLPPGSSDGGGDALNVISQASSGSSSIAGLGYGLPLSRAYAEYFGGGIAVQSLFGWGTDVYLRLKGVGKIE